ncbi:MAG: SGNH/GDSL hydrolase family protein [Methanobacterium sp.]|uniref:SGNH/GDSL hydrolase family protein n=1 Tax=Methanobacterium sp. TaxID=2164 RepID=UPI003C709C62
MTRKTILCYGDSITWGYNPVNPNRMTLDERWTGVLSKGLGEDYKVIEEGLNGRTTIRDDPFNNSYKNGLKYLVPCLESHKPIDLCILLLGTNDLKKRFGLSAIEIAHGIRVLIDTIKKSAAGPCGLAPEILLMVPPYIKKLNNFPYEFEDSYQKSYNLPDHYAQIAKDYKCEFLDTSKIIVASEIDGVHPDMDEHLKLGNAVLEMVKIIMGN